MDVQKNRQKVFDKALAHLRKQGKKSIGDDGCAYRGNGGVKCAIGIFIANSKYRSNIESLTANSNKIISVLPEYVASTGGEFLCDLQSRLHDDINEDRFAKELETAAARFVTVYNLQYSAPETTP